jgi:hypothetical protein
MDTPNNELPVTMYLLQYTRDMVCRRNRIGKDNYQKPQVETDIRIAKDAITVKEIPE